MPDTPRLSVTVLVTTYHLRAGMLARALASVARQTYPPDRLHVLWDLDSLGAAEARNRALAEVDTDWVAFLDDDDELLPHHLQALVAAQAATGADVVYPWFEVVGGTDPLGRMGVPFDAEAMRAGNYVPLPVLARVGLLRGVGGFQPPPWASPDNPCEDWGCWLACLDAGATFHHVPTITWRWHHHFTGPNRNTSGRPWREVASLQQ